ncbi:3-oxoacyl-[acyl-carrier protein] reductase [Microdochium nivale]|nr:3-oxoacyl-[acyl-carrier protein] reductase [Microdochium nivale]
MSSSGLPRKPRNRELDLVGKVAVISGASRGIGRAIAFNLASRGCSILGTCSADASLPQVRFKLNDDISSLYAATSRQRPESLKIVGIVADIFSQDCATTIADCIAKSLGSRVDIFVNSACDPMPGTIGQMTAAEIQHSLLGNVQTPVLIVDELVRRKYFQPNSRIIYLSSMRARTPWHMQLMYGSTKSAGESLCRTWAQAFGGKEQAYAFMQGTTANSIAVGLTETEAVMNCGPEMVKQFQDENFPTQSIPRFGQPDDVADVVGMLCSEDARWVTGCVVSASGGFTKLV